MAKMILIPNNSDDQMKELFGTNWEEEIWARKLDQLKQMNRPMMTATDPTYPINCRCVPASELTEEDKAARKAPEIKVGWFPSIEDAESEDVNLQIELFERLVCSSVGIPVATKICDPIMSDSERDQAIAKKRKLREDN